MSDATSQSEPPSDEGRPECALLARFVDAYVDDEFAEGERLEAEAHLASCAGCRRLVQERANLKVLVRVTSPRPSAPPALRQRLDALLDEADAEAPVGQALVVESAPWWRPARLSPARLGALAPLFAPPSRLLRFALPLLLLALPLLGYWQGQKAPPQLDVGELAESVVRHRNLPVEIAGDQQAVRSWFNGKVPFAVRPPHLEPTASLRGGRLVNLGAREAAYLVYERPTPGTVRADRESGRGAAVVDQISVFVFDAHGLPRAPGRGRVQMIGSHEVLLEGTHGYSIAVFRDRGLGYVITADIDEAELLRLLADAIPSPR